MDFYGSMAFYGAVALLTAVNAEGSVRFRDGVIRSFFAWNTVLIPALTAGLRYGIGTDYALVYFPEFCSLRADPGYASRMEPGYVLLNRLVILLGGGFQLVLFLVSAITVLFVYAGLKQYREKLSVGLGMLVYMLLYFQMSFDIVRQSAAMAIVFYSLRSVYDRRLFKFTALIALACTFHISALLMFPFYFLYGLYGKPKYAFVRFLSYLLLIFLALNYDKLLYPIMDRVDGLRYYSVYLQETQSFSFSIGVVARTVPFLAPGFLIYGELKRDRSMLFQFSLLCMGCIARLMAYTTVYFTERIAYYFLFSQAVLVPFYYRKLKEKRKTWVGLAVVGFIFFLWIYDFFVMGSCRTVPYRFYFQK